MSSEAVKKSARRCLLALTLAGTTTPLSLAADCVHNCCPKPTTLYSPTFGYFPTKWARWPGAPYPAPVAATAPETLPKPEAKVEPKTETKTDTPDKTEAKP